MPSEADALLDWRIALYKVWKPLTSSVEELPLAMLDAITHADDNMQPDQALRLKTFDSEAGGWAHFMRHTAF